MQFVGTAGLEPGALGCLGHGCPPARMRPAHIHADLAILSPSWPPPTHACTDGYPGVPLNPALTDLTRPCADRPAGAAGADRRHSGSHEANGYTHTRGQAAGHGLRRGHCAAQELTVRVPAATSSGPPLC